MPLNIHVQIYLSYISKYSYPYIPLGCFLLCSFPLHLCLSFLALHFLNPVDNPYSSWLELVIHILIVSSQDSSGLTCFQVDHHSEAYALQWKCSDPRILLPSKYSPGSSTYKPLSSNFGIVELLPAFSLSRASIMIDTF
jgi:hypothetical protein